MQIDSHTIDRIVAGVLRQLGTGTGVDGASGAVTAETRRRGGHAESVAVTTNVVTADVLMGGLNGSARVVVAERAIVTPAAWDAAREHGIEIVRSSTGGFADGPTGAPRRSAAKRDELEGATSPLAIVISNTGAVERLWDDLKPTWQREFLGCTDDAAALAISAVCRGESSVVVVLAEQTHRAACLANRNARLKAVAVRDAGDVRAIKLQLRANVWCIDPTGRSWFELRNLFRAVTDP